ncbi:MAG: hypothetical protein HOL04_04545 [Gammaproteobacteria bacterium]|jgi:tetratricopeptide (TPR) repeat protein|nr:hypothetical protein [Gammaproteobacteria bacterium]MBT4607849.1 hypothetical protein [Thiotrichales bacterium]MBT3966969.1 hypothetical protein [Gammaproteobacteria bacterium]MBT4081588.1 hypothetical protein [Gammaproteobacteria bacterium]MBT4331529.1 hypothetical protein [Gammaproteobacteria bacterium]
MKLIAVTTLLLLHTLSANGSEMGTAVDAINEWNDIHKIEKVVRKLSKELQEWEKALVYSNFGWRLLREGEYKQAEKYFRKSARYNEKSYEVIGLALSLFNQGRYNASLKVVQKMLEKEGREQIIPKAYKESAHYLLGINYLQLKQKRRACNHWRSSSQIRKKQSSKDSYQEKSLQEMRQHCR